MAQKHNISLTLVQGTDGPEQWEMTYGGKKYSPNGFPKIDLPHDSKSHDFEFKIVSPDTVTFKAGTGTESPIYIMEVDDPTGKPTPGVINNQITEIKLSDDKSVLTFKDRNKGAPRMLSYQLNFDGAPALDPIIQNGGGTGGREAYLLIAAVSALALAYVAYQLFFDK